MPYNPTTQRIEIDTTTTPHTGVSIHDVNTCLAGGSLDLGTLCRSAVVNPMAKYKPVEYNTTGVTGRTSGSGYWRGNNGQCGLNIPNDIYNNRFTFASGTTAWSRALPSTKYRLLDFDGYDGSEQVTLDALKIPTGHLTEDSLQTITFDNGEPVFHITLNSQDASGYFLTINDIGVRFGSTTHAIGDLYPRVLLVSTDNTISLELESGARVRSTEHGADPEESEELTLGEIINRGDTQITFGCPYTFYIQQSEGTNKTVYGGDVYTDGRGNNFLITGAYYEGNREWISEITCFRSSGNYSVASSGTLNIVSGSGSSPINYYNMNTLQLNTGSKQFYVFPFLTNYSWVCGTGHNAHLMTIASVTNWVNALSPNVVWSRPSSDIQFNISCSFVNGFNTSKAVTVKLKVSSAMDYSELFEEGNRTSEYEETVTVNALSTYNYSTVKTRTYNTYSGVIIEYSFTDSGGYPAGSQILEIMFDSNGNVFDPLVQQ